PRAVRLVLAEEPGDADPGEARVRDLPRPELDRRHFLRQRRAAGEGPGPLVRPEEALVRRRPGCDVHGGDVTSGAFVIRTAVQRMRAVVHDRYGPPGVLRVGDVARPVPQEDEVLVEVHASSVTRSDAMRVRSKEYRFARLATGVRRPRRTSLGTQFAGRVAEVGPAVTALHVGGDVFGVEGGANAEYVTVRESEVIARKPGELTYEQAAVIPDGALLALTCLQPATPLERKSFLVYGAAGSIGTAAVQLLAHHF